MTEVILKDNSTADAKDVLPLIITSTVENVLQETSEQLDAKDTAQIESVAWQIVDYIEISTHEKVDVCDVIAELKRQV